MTPPYFNINQDVARKYHVPYWVMMGVYGKETAFGTNVRTSSAGAVGPYQFLPSTAAAYHYPLTNNPNKEQFRQQADAAAHYLSDLYKQYHSWDAALRHYSGGGYGEQDVRDTSGTFGAGGYNDDGSKKSAAKQAGEKVDSMGKFLGKFSIIFKSGFWLRVGLIVGGLALLGFGVAMIGKQYTVPAVIGKMIGGKK